MSLYQGIYDLALKMKVGTEHLSYGRDIIKHWCNQEFTKYDKGRKIRILDIGCGKGDDLINIQKIGGKDCELFGIESYDKYKKICGEKGIKTESINIEQDQFPFDDAFFDIVIINQVLEHTKEIFFVLSEISRILKPHGKLILGVPNLGTWHDRIILLLGQQPSGIKVPGPHVRGFTIPGIKKLIVLDDYFEVTNIKGSGFYPFPLYIAKVLSKVFPSLATSIFFFCERTEKSGTYIEVLNTRFYETNYYQGNRR